LLAASTQPDPHEAVLVDKVLSSRRLVKEHEVAGSAEAAPLVVFAHAPFEMPLVLPDRICIDTGSVHGNMLTALELPAMRFYHA
jgi:serine/threonine protein phosphatase 1